MQDAENMKVAGGMHQIGYHYPRVLYEHINMLKVLERLLRENFKNKTVKILDTEVEKRLEIMKQLLQIARINNLESPEINGKDLELVYENEVHNQECSNIQQETVNEASSLWHMPKEGESNQQSDDKNDVFSMVTDEFASNLSEASKDYPDVDIVPSMDFDNLVAARLVLLDKAKKRKLADEEILEENFKPCGSQGRSNFIDVKMASSSSSKISTAGSSKILLKITQSSHSKEEHDKLASEHPQVDLKNLKPEWLAKFVFRTFFEPCSEHPIRRNELNKYCIDCNASLCQYCVSLASHSNHRLLKIYRHVYKDVVPLDEIERHIDCSRIQPYRCNRQMVIALTPLPHCGSKSNDKSTCLTCKRKLIEYELYSYCSLSCKAEACIKKQNEHAPPCMALNQGPKSKKSRKRKGIPHRAPFF